jgi:DNA-binding PadR family transcriptional regulator
MRVELTVLGLLSESNLYGYEIKKKINERVGCDVDIKFGSIYYIINKALKKGWIEKNGNAKGTGAPERIIYELLPEGRQRYKNMLKKYFDNIRLHFDIDFVLMFYDSLSEEQKNNFINERTSLVKEKLLSIKEKIRNDTSRSSKNPQIHLYKYLENHLRAEQAWLKSLSK